MIANKAAVTAKLNELLQKSENKSETAEQIVAHSIKNLQKRDRDMDLHYSFIRGIGVERVESHRYKVIESGLNALYKKYKEEGSRINRTEECRIIINRLSMCARYTALELYFRDTGLFNEKQKAEIDEEAKYWGLTIKVDTKTNSFHQTQQFWKQQEGKEQCKS